MNTKTAEYDYIVSDAEAWHVPLFIRGRLSLQKVLEVMGDWKLSSKDVPLIIRLVENPKYDIGLFAGNVSLFSHDCKQILLGRGLLTKEILYKIQQVNNKTQIINSTKIQVGKITYASKSTITFRNVNIFL